MAKKAYIGVNGVARQIKKMYVGVGGVARKVKKAYIGVAGVARCFFDGGGELSYYGTASGLASTACDLAATTVGNYALFGGGYNGSYVSSVNAYNASLTKSTPTGFSTGTSSLAATTVGNYALFGGGTVSSSSASSATRTVYSYNKSLTRSGATKGLLYAACHLAATTVGDYALFGGGRRDSTIDGVKTVTAYNAAKTRSETTELREAVYDLAATTVGNYALFGGGYSALMPTTTVTAYNKSLTRSSPTSLSEAKAQHAATTVGDYALFGGGLMPQGNSYRPTRTATVNAYNKSLTRSIPTSLSEAKANLTATTVGGYALFGGGDYLPPYTESTVTTAKVEAYDASLTKTISTNLDSSRRRLAATTLENYALFGGGYMTDYGGTYENTVDVYTVS